MPRVRAPRPPVTTFVSYPIIPPSIIIPANSSGLSAVDSCPAYSSRVLLIICLSLTRLSNPVLSTTLNHLPLPADLRASMSISVPPCVTAVEKEAMFCSGLRCPVLSTKP